MNKYKILIFLICIHNISTYKNIKANIYLTTYIKNKTEFALPT